MKQLLRDLAEIGAGQGAPQGDSNYCDDGTPFVKAGNLESLTTGAPLGSIQKVSDSVAKEHRLKLYPKGTVLFAKSGMSCLKGYVYVLPKDAYVVSHLACVTPKEDLSEYLRYYFLYRKPNQLVKDASYPSISLADIGDLEIDAKDKQTRKHIIATLSLVERVIQLRQKQLSALDDLIKARFVEMFGDETNPYQWPVVNVEDVANVSVGVVIKPAQYYTDAEHGVKAFRSLNIGAGTINDSDWVYFSHEGNDKNSKSQLRENDLLIVRSGAPGTACVVPKVYEGCNAIDIIIARPETDKVNPYYLCTYTNLPHGKRQIDEGTGGAAQQHFNVGKYNKLQLMLPPLKQQNEFVSFLEQIDKSKSVIQKSLDETQLLFDSLMQKHFR
ncbi:MAG: restriction endonuclease subunit S [Oscillospiraceae bacterium]|nr:restriction endonuclease subunit S [Oscillospiraceae bacterium]